MGKAMGCLRLKSKGTEEEHIERDALQVAPSADAEPDTVALQVPHESS